MRKEVKVRFELNSEEVKEALYDCFVRKLKENNINAVFSSNEINIEGTASNLISSLEIHEIKELD